MAGIIERILRFKAIEWQGGKLSVLNIPGLLIPLYAMVYQHKLLKERYGEKEAAIILYNMGKLQAKGGFQLISKKFGYNKTLKNKFKLLKFNTTQGESIGIGKYKFVKTDFKNNEFIVRGKSTWAEEYKKRFGIQRENIDHLIRGMNSAFFEELTGEKMFTIETQCLCMGRPYCEFITKPLIKWDKENILFKKQFVPDLLEKENITL
jgi:predicted hydrocarbon binding protein